jgi:tetratricopeptide (TPR) repeat protein
MALRGASTLAMFQGDQAGARNSAIEAKACSSSIGDQDGVARALNALGDAVLMSGAESFDLAAAHYEEALSVFREAGNQRGIAGVLTNIGNLAWERGDLDRATELHREALGRYRDLGNERGVAWSLSNLGVLNVLRGRPASAFPLLQEALELYVALGDRDGIAESLEGLGGVGSTAEAARLLGAAEALRKVLGRSLSTGEVATNALIADSIRAEIGDDAFTAAWAAGRSLTIEEAVATALAMTLEQVRVS